MEIEIIRIGEVPLLPQLHNGIFTLIYYCGGKIMKKWASLLGAFILGVTVASSAGTVVAKVQSLVGQKVTGELTVVVNGKELSDKGVVINGRTNAPVRAIADAINADLKLEGKKINITTDSISDVSSRDETTVSNNEYIGRSKESLQKLKASIQNESLLPMEKERAALIEEIKILQEFGESPSLIKKQEVLVEYDSMIKERNAEINKINEALQALEK